MPYSPGGYSWLCIAPEPKNVPMTEKEKTQLDQDMEAMESAAKTLDTKIRRFHSLCKEYETKAGTAEGEKLFEELDVLKKEIRALSKEIARALGDSADITHLD